MADRSPWRSRSHPGRRAPLKSSARAIGAIHLGELCEAIENSPLEKDGSPHAICLASFDIELERVRHWIGARGWLRSVAREKAA